MVTTTASDVAHCRKGVAGRGEDLFLSGGRLEFSGVFEVSGLRVSGDLLLRVI